MGDRRHLHLPVAGIGVLSGSSVIAVPALVIAALGLLTMAVVMSALSVVYQTALYRYAIGQPVSAYRPELMASAFRHKNRRRPRVRAPSAGPPSACGLRVARRCWRT